MMRNTDKAEYLKGRTNPGFALVAAGVTYDFRLYLDTRSREIAWPCQCHPLDEIGWFFNEQNPI